MIQLPEENEAQCLMGFSAAYMMELALRDVKCLKYARSTVTDLKSLFTLEYKGKVEKCATCRYCRQANLTLRKSLQSAMKEIDL